MFTKITQKLFGASPEPEPVGPQQNCIPQQQFQYQYNNEYNDNSNDEIAYEQNCCGGPSPPMFGTEFGRNTNTGADVRLIPNSKTRPNDELIAVIVTICRGSSYDALFSGIPQEGPEGTRIAVYQVNPNSLDSLADAIAKLPIKKPDENNENKEVKDQKEGDTTLPPTPAAPADTPADTPIEQLVKDIAEVDADSVVFNWECCSGCSKERGFDGKSNVMQLMELLITRGHMIMCSDFSLKALIKSWTSKTSILGPNPFVQLGECDSSFTLAFDPKKLQDCPSSQLQKVGDLCKEKGSASVHAMSSTIVYSLDKAIADNKSYKVDVLTIIPECGGFSMSGIDKKFIHSCNKRRGVAGHVMLEYPSGGRILTSAGHWIELAKLDVDEATLLRVAQQEYGNAYVQEMQTEMAGCTDDVQRQSYVSKKAAYMVQSSCPQERSKGWGRSKASNKASKY